MKSNIFARKYLEMEQKFFFQRLQSPTHWIKNVCHHILSLIILCKDKQQPIGCDFSCHLCQPTLCIKIIKRETPKFIIVMPLAN